MRRLICRIMVLLLATFLYLRYPDTFVVLEPGSFFAVFSLLHVLWLWWIIDVIIKIMIPRGSLALGSAKQSLRYFCPSQRPATPERLRDYLKQENRRALVVFLLWSGVGIVLAILWKIRILGRSELFLISVLFYVCDLICVLFWCPFRVFILHNRCCTTCRIFNWDQIMITTPLFCLNSFYGWTLIAAALLLFLLWEYRIRRYPERFYEGTNEALGCKQCIDLLCGRR